MAKTRAQKNREIRQEELRARLAGQKHIEKVIDNIEEIEKLDFFQKGADSKEIDYKLCQANKFRMDALKTANDQRMRLVNKYLPDVKQQEIQLSGQLDFAQVSDECSEEEWEEQYGDG